MSSSKKIIIIGPAHPLRGGLASYNERLARACQHAGHRVSVYTFSLQYPSFLFPGTTQYSTEPAPADIDIRIDINAINPLNWFRIGNKLKKELADIIVVRYWLPFMGPCLGTILRQVKKNKRTKVICIADNIIPHEKRPGDEAFTRYFIKPVDAFITMSQKVLNDLKKISGKSSRYVAHPLYDNFGNKVSQYEAREKLGIRQEDIVFLFFGFIRKYKGLDILLEAMQLLLSEKAKANEQTGNIKLLIAGEFYEDRKPYDELMQKPGIHDNLILRTNFVADSDVKYYLCSADAVVQPYRNATQSGVTPLAYHFDVPMIVTNVGGLPALVPDGKVGLVAEPDAASIAEKMRLFLQYGKDHFLPHLQEEKKKYGWDVMVNEIISLANDLKQ